MDHGAPSPNDAELLSTLAQEFRVLRRGWITALQKPNGGVRQIVSEVFRRLVARTMAQQLALAVEDATSPFQCALSTRSGCDVETMKQRLSDPLTGFVLEGLRNVDGGGDALQSVLWFTRTWEDEEGVNHEVFRVVHPQRASTFAEHYDAKVWGCLQRLLGMDGDRFTEDLARLPLSMGGLGLRSVRTSPAAHWASWVDSLPMIQKRHPAVVRLIVAQLSGNAEGPHFGGAIVSMGAPVGCQLCWCTSTRMGSSSQAKQLRIAFFQHGFVPRLTDTQQAMVRSHSGPMAGVPLVAFPTSPLFRFDASAFRALLLCCACRVAVHSTPLARGFRGAGSQGPLLWRVRRLRLASAGKQVAGLFSTSESVTWIRLHGVHRIRGDLKWFNWRLTVRVDGVAVARARRRKDHVP